MAHDVGAKILHVKSDSLLVVNQVNGKFQSKDSKMMAYLEFQKEKSKQFKKFTIEQIPRDQNTQDDALANLGSAFSDSMLENIPIVHLSIPSMNSGNVVQIENQEYN